MPEVNIKKSKLLSLKTDFRTLKYSGDQPFDGTSQQPYIQAPLEKDWNTNTSTTYTDVTSAGGSLKLVNVNTGQTPTVLQLHQSMDTARVAGFLQTTQKGKLFTASQKTLQFQNPKTEVGTTLNISPVENVNGFFPQLWSNLKNTTSALEYTRVYNDNQNLLKQVEVSGTGNYYDRAGNYPVTPASLKYYQVVKNKKTDKNRLVLLYNTKIATTDYRSLPDLNTTTELVKLGIARDQNTLFNYLGGPTSTDSIKSTFIQRYDFTNTWSSFDSFNAEYKYTPKAGYIHTFVKGSTSTEFNTLVDAPTNGATLDNVTVTAQRFVAPPTKGADLTTSRATPNLDYTPSANQSLTNRAYDTTFQVENYSEASTSPLNRPYALSYQDIRNKATREDLTNPTIKDDFRMDIKALDVGTPGYAGDAGNGYLDKTYKVGNPGSKNIDKSIRKLVGYNGNDQGVDQINATDIIQKESDSKGNDLIKCIIRPVETSGFLGAIADTILVFRAFISNFSDNISANYAEHTYVGRGEKFYTYQTADRRVNFQLAIAAQSRAEMKPLYRKLNYLISQLYPEYSGLGETAKGNGFMKSPLVKLTIGDYFYNTPGILTGLQIQIPEDSPWELESSNMHNGTTEGILSTTGDMYQLPHYLTLNLQFTPIHNFIPRRAAATLRPNANTGDNKNYYIPPFITPHENSSEFYGSLKGKNRFNIG